MIVNIEFDKMFYCKVLKLSDGIINLQVNIYTNKSCTTSYGRFFSNSHKTG